MSGHQKIPVLGRRRCLGTFCDFLKPFIFLFTSVYKDIRSVSDSQEHRPVHVRKGWSVPFVCYYQQFSVFNVL